MSLSSETYSLVSLSWVLHGDWSLDTQSEMLCITHLGENLLGLSLIGGGLGLAMLGSLTLVGGLLLRSLSSVRHIHQIKALIFQKNVTQNYVSTKSHCHAYLLSLLDHLSPSLRPLSSLKKKQINSCHNVYLDKILIERFLSCIRKTTARDEAVTSLSEKHSHFESVDKLENVSLSVCFDGAINLQGNSHVSLCVAI